MHPKGHAGISLAVSCLALVISITRVDTEVIYSSRAEFSAAIGASITDTYSATDYGPGVVILNNAEMDAVFNETRYTPTGFPQSNIVGPELVLPRAYCAGCNGSFILDFTHTTIGGLQGVYGVGFDYVNNGTPTYDAFITFGDSSTLDVPLNFALTSADFFGITSSSLISSIALGLPNGGATTSRAFAAPNLTIAAAPVPEPHSLALLTPALIGFGLLLARRVWRA